MNTENVTQILGSNGSVQNKDETMKFTRKKNQKLNNSVNGGEKETSVIEDNIPIPILSSRDIAESRPLAQWNNAAYNFKDHSKPLCFNLTDRYFLSCVSPFCYNWCAMCFDNYTSISNLRNFNPSLVLSPIFCIVAFIFQIP